MATKTLEKASVIGIGQLGLCFALTLEKAGFQVLGMDIDAERVSRINQRGLQSSEPGVSELLRSSVRFEATTDLAQALQFSDLIFVIVPTPSLPTGDYDHSRIDAVLQAAKEIRESNPAKHLVISSTTMPGYCDSAAETLKGTSWSVSYNPEFVAQGSILHDQRNPHFVLIGEGNPAAGDLLSAVYEKVCENRPKIHRMSRISAEITKLALNCFLTTKISFANIVGDIALRAGADPNQVLDAVGSDARIGKAYLRHGFGFGGPCLPRDNRALAAYAESLDMASPICRATDLSNEMHLENQVREFARRHPLLEPVEIGPVTYKQGSHSIEESQQLAFAVSLAKKGYPVILRDAPVVLAKVREKFGDLFSGYREV